MDNKDIVREKTFFEIPIDINTGEILEIRDGQVYKGEEVIDDLNYIIARFNEAANDRFRKYFSRVVQSRGIKIVDEIDQNDHDVRNLINRAKQKRKGKISNNEISAIITRVKNLHQPQNMLISFQMILWTMLYDDLFIITNKGIDTRFSIDVEDSYWEGARVKTKTDALDQLLASDLLPPEPFMDNTDPLEIMLAITTTFVNDHKELSDALQPMLKKAYVGIGFLNTDQSQEDAVFLGSQLDEVLG